MSEDYLYLLHALDVLEKSIFARHFIWTTRHAIM